MWDVDDGGDGDGNGGGEDYNDGYDHCDVYGGNEQYLAEHIMMMMNSMVQVL